MITDQRGLSCFSTHDIQSIAFDLRTPYTSFIIITHTSSLLTPSNLSVFASDSRGEVEGGGGRHIWLNSRTQPASCRLLTSRIAPEVSGGTNCTDAAGPPPLMACKYMQMNDAIDPGSREALYLFSVFVSGLPCGYCVATLWYAFVSTGDVKFTCHAIDWEGWGLGEGETGASR